MARYDEVVVGCLTAFVGPEGTAAPAIGTKPARVSAGVTSITVTDPGSGYTSAPGISFSAGGGGSGAAATATLTSDGRVQSIRVTAPGSGYTSAPTITVAAAPSGGTTATATARVGTAGWTQLGLYGSVNYSDEGVKVTISQATEKIRGCGSTGAIKAFRTEEDVMVSLTLRDLRPEMLTYALSSLPPNDGKIGLGRGVEVQTGALLLRGSGKSPYSSQLALEWWFPLGYFSSDSIEIDFSKSAPADLEMEYSVLADAAQADGYQLGWMLAQGGG